MARFVYLADIVSKMADHAPPAWCKLALHGAMLSERVALYAAKGRIRTYVPPYHLQEEDLPLPRALRTGCDPNHLIETYGLQNEPRPNKEDINIWQEQWDGEGRQIAVGWLIFNAPFDWSNPAIDFDIFQIPRGFETVFSYDDIHYDEEADSALWYEGTFERLCLSLEDAEALVPMARFEGEAFTKPANPLTGILGRPRGTGYHAADNTIVQKMLDDHNDDPTIPVRQLAAKYVGEAVGAGTDDSKIKRLERRFRSVV